MPETVQTTLHNQAATFILPQRQRRWSVSGALFSECETQDSYCQIALSRVHAGSDEEEMFNSLLT